MIEVANPRTGAVDYRFEAVDEAGLAKLAARLRAAQTAWAARSIEERCKALLGWADSIERHKDAIAAALEIDTGRRRIARLEVEGAIASIRGWAAGAPHLLPKPQWVEGRANPAIRHQAQDVAYALTGVISPWNFPLTLSLIDTIPALIAGSAVIVKPSEVTPRFAEPLSVAIEEAGLCDLLAFAPGDGATGAALIDQVDVVCFTGSVPTGKKVAYGES